VVFLSKSESVQVFFNHLFIYASPLEIPLSNREGSHIKFHHISIPVPARTWISNIICHGLFICSMSCGETRLFTLLIVVELLTITV
jgi:hypothetical protein